ncbi:MAG: glycosyltransferase [Bacteroidetes bacterium]|nr:glycosyltransferase [Bacteroidota bacterium]
MKKLTASIVLYNTDKDVLNKVVNSFTQTNLDIDLYLIDNSASENSHHRYRSNNIHYIFNNANIGYGRAHNIALRKAIEISDYHIVLNPDIEFTSETLDACIAFMNQQKNVGLLMPKVLYPNGEIQYLCKQIPTPFDLIMRRFIPSFLKPMFKARLDAYELKFKDFSKSMEIPNLSGCFMFIRCEALKTVGLFDENFFMYLDWVKRMRILSTLLWMEAQQMVPLSLCNRMEIKLTSSLAKKTKVCIMH